jgi:molecular chaperone DnaK
VDTGLPIGIDFGTTKTVCAAWLDGSVQSLPGQRGRDTIPSFVLVRRSGEVFVGWDAKEASKTSSEECVSISSVKRKMGRAGESSWSWWKGYPQLVSSYILAVAKQCAGQELERPVDSAVIAVPAHFNVIQRRATLEAARIAGIQPMRVINEATAAAIAYDHHCGHVRESTTLVFDFGGGTLDVSIVESGENLYEVVATAGDGSLGGIDFDETIARHIAQEQKTRFGRRKFILGSGLEHELYVLAEDVKKQLTSVERCCLDIPGFIRQGKEYHDLHYELKRDEFETLTSKLLARARAMLEEVIRQSGRTPEAVIIVGGSSRIPSVRAMVEGVVGRTPIVGDEHWVAHGAALLAGVLAGEVDSVTLLDVCSSTLSVETRGGVATRLIERSKTIPTEKTHSFTTTEDNQTAVDIMIYAGESAMVGDNQALGKVRLDVLPAARGVPKFDVTFSIDVDGMLRVSAKDHATGRQAEAEVDSPYALNNAQLARLTKQVQQWLPTQLGQELMAQATVLLKEGSDVLHPSIVQKLQVVLDELQSRVSVEQIRNAQARVSEAEGVLAIVREVDTTAARLCTAWRSMWNCLPMGPSQASELVRVETVNGRPTDRLVAAITSDLDNHTRILYECSQMKRHAESLLEMSQPLLRSVLPGEIEKWLALSDGSSPASLDQAEALLVEGRRALGAVGRIFQSAGERDIIPAEVIALAEMCLRHREIQALVIEDNEWGVIRSRIADSLQATAEKEDVSRDFLRALRELSPNGSIFVEVAISSRSSMTRRHIFDMLAEEPGAVGVSRLLTLLTEVEDVLHKPLLDCLRAHAEHMADADHTEVLAFANACLRRPEIRAFVMEFSEWEVMRSRIADSLQATAEKGDVSRDFLRALCELSPNGSIFVEVAISSRSSMTRRHIFDMLAEEPGAVGVSRLLTLLTEVEDALHKPLLDCLRAHAERMADTESQLAGYAEQWASGERLGVRSRMALRRIRRRAPGHADLISMLLQRR